MLVERSIKWWNESNRDSVTPNEIYEALTDDTVKGCSIYLVDVMKPNTKPRKTTKPPIPGITSFFEFQFNKKFLIVNKYAGIGNGLRIQQSSLIPCESVLNIVEQGGWLESANCWVNLKGGKDNGTEKEDNDLPTEDNQYRCPIQKCTQSFTTCNDLDEHVYRQDHSFAVAKETMLDIAKREISTSIETEEAARIAVDQTQLLTSRCDELTHKKGWAMKESRASRMNPEVQAFAQKFFLDNRAEGKRASAHVCCELLRNEKTSSGSYRFLLAECPSEKSLTSSFGAWETKRLRPIATPARGGGRKKQNVATVTDPTANGSPATKRKHTDEDGPEDDEDHEDEKVDDESLIAALVEELADEIFSRD